MKLSVLLPVYNAGNLLARAIVSILSQDFTDFEFIIIDDASKDESAKVIREFAGRDARIKPVFHEQNAGLSATLNEGLDLAATPFVVRMDQDDESLPRRLGMQYVFAKGRPNVAAAGSFVYHIGMTPRHDTLVRLPVSSAEIFRQLESTNCLYHPSVIMNRAMVLEAGGYRKQFKNSEDYDLWLRLRKVHELANIPVPLLRYNFTIDGMTLGRKWEQSRYAFLAQEANRRSNRSWAEIERVANDRHAQQDKTIFLNHVLLGNVNELLRLGRADEAQQLMERLCGDLFDTRSNESPMAWVESLEKSDREKMTYRYEVLRKGIRALQERLSYALTLKDEEGRANAQQENEIAALRQDIAALDPAVWAAQCELDGIRRSRWDRFLKKTSNRAWSVRTKILHRLGYAKWSRYVSARDAKRRSLIQENALRSNGQFQFPGLLRFATGSAAPAVQSFFTLQSSRDGQWPVFARFAARHEAKAQQALAFWPKTKPLVSVVIPCHNCGNSLLEAVNSALAQTWRDLEVVVVDDGSDDAGTLRVIDGLRLPGVSVIRRQKSNVPCAQSTGVAHASGRYICCLNAGDKLEPTYIERRLLRLVIEGFDFCGIWRRSPGIESDARRPEDFDPKILLESDGLIDRPIFSKRLGETAGGLDPNTADGERDWEFRFRSEPTGAQEPATCEAASACRAPAVASTDAPMKELLDRDMKLESPRVLVCLPFLTDGGSEKALSQVCRGLREEGFHFTVVATGRTSLSQAITETGFESATSEIFCLPECLSSESWNSFISYLISSRRVDILWQHDSALIYDFLPELKTSFPKLKVVDHLLDDAGPAANNRRYDYLIDLNIVGSNAVRAWLTGHGESEDRIRVIPNGADATDAITVLRDSFLALLLHRPSAQLVEAAVL